MLSRASFAGERQRQMITAEQIRQKAERLYAKVLRAWLEGDESFFPRTVPSPKTLDEKDIPSAIRAVQRLRNSSKEMLGYGYTVEWASRRSRKFGQNEFPQRILFESREDLLRLIGRRKDFRDFTSAVTRLRAEFPKQLESWFPSNVKLLRENAGEVAGLIAVVNYFRAHPQPNRFARELPIPVDTKFIERHQRILRPLLDRILPPHAIRADEIQFERRFGVRDHEPFLILRCLDPVIQQELGLSFPELALPLQSLAALPIKSAAVFVVENRVTLRTFPPQRRGVALEGRGNAVTDLRDVKWLATNEVCYWGDLDMEGFHILSSLRMIFPRTRTLLMDVGTLETWWSFTSKGTGRELRTPDHLTDAERNACERCRIDNLRLEQERIPQSAVVDALARLASCK